MKNNFLHLYFIDNTKNEYESKLDKILQENYSTKLIRCHTGKPYLQNSTFGISLSHSNKFTAVLVSSSTEIGVDIEAIQPLENISTLSLFDKDEQNYLKKVEGKNFLETAYVLWTLKESYFKVFGKWIGSIHILESKGSRHNYKTYQILNMVVSMIYPKHLEGKLIQKLSEY